MNNLRKNDKASYSKFKLATKTDSFVRYVLTNVDTSLAATDEEIIKAYAELVKTDSVKLEFLDLFLTELELTRSVLYDLLGEGIETRRVNHHYSNSLRAPLMAELHKKQIDLLGRWRAEKEKGGDQVNELQRELMLTINAIVSAMRNTG